MSPPPVILSLSKDAVALGTAPFDKLRVTKDKLRVT
jgi:hypothetical protein